MIIKKNIGELSFYSDYTSTNKVDTSAFVDGLEHNKIVFINGRIEKIDFDYEKKDQIEIIDQSETINKFNNNSSLSDLNSAFTNKSFKIVVKEGYQLTKPLIIYHTTNSKIWSKNINLRLNFELYENSSLRLIDLFRDTSEKNFLNIFYNFDLKENSIRSKFINEEDPIQAPFLGTKVLNDVDIDLNKLIFYLDTKALFSGQWQIKKGKNQSVDEYNNYLDSYAKPLLDKWLGTIIEKKLISPKAVYGYFRCGRNDNSIFYLMINH